MTPGREMVYGSDAHNSADGLYQVLGYATV